LFNLVDLTKNPGLKPPAFVDAQSYDPPEPWWTDEPATVKDIADFYTRYMMADTLGLISVRHRLIADQVSKGANDNKCIRLSEQHSHAVDFPKTGTQVYYWDITRPVYMPDWHAGENFDPINGDYYQSERALGVLFRAVRLGEAARLCDPDTIFPAPDIPPCETIKTVLQPLIDAHLADFITPDADAGIISRPRLLRLLRNYSSQLDYIRVSHVLSEDTQNSISEGEVFVGSIFAKTSQPHKRKELIIRMRSMAKELVQKVRNKLAGEGEGDDATKLWLLNAWNAWNVAQEMQRTGGSSTFGWVALGSVLEAMKTLDDGKEERME